MADIVERLRDLAAIDNCQASLEAAAEIERLRERTEYWPDNAERDAVIRHQKEEIERLRAALEDVMIGGNSLAQIIGADHPPHGTPYSEALAHYGGGVKYEAWCCWNTIMQARAALEEGRT